MSCALGLENGIGKLGQRLWTKEQRRREIDVAGPRLEDAIHLSRNRIVGALQRTLGSSRRWIAHMSPSTSACAAMDRISPRDSRFLLLVPCSLKMERFGTTENEDVKAKL